LEKLKYYKTIQFGTSSEVREFMRWIEVNFGKFTLNGIWEIVGVGGRLYSYRISFDNESDYVEFSLRWV
jgi:hypothetical protein